MDPTLLVLAGAGGTALVQAMVTDTWAAVRDSAARLLGRGDAQRESSALVRLDASRETLRQATPATEESVLATQSALWSGRFEAVLEEHPDRAALLRSLLSLAEEAVGAHGSRVHTQHISAARDAYVAGRDQTVRFGRLPEGGHD
ncbi:hypothetical protein JIX56_20800 [Streptomyces sp. CA-210063]|uniref:hypothetical protein n=1 Tax=Streptomyces sp. CA-210063 TaxID=2801029 RepID=UPI00214CF80D|nr:hypothetical protein [Streptomyces sp. CA-210063]UUU32145.1 hypothetical protein JIX56_20800 [Streptomyces sp. CA-210063]